MSGLSFDMDSLNTFVSFQFNTSAEAEDEELKPQQTVINDQGRHVTENISLIQRRAEILENLAILKEVLAAL